MTIAFKMLDTRYSIDALGLIPLFLHPEDDRPAREQFHERYSHGGGWLPMKGWKQGPTGELLYEGDTETLPPIAVATLRDEVIRIHPQAWVSITQPDGSFEVSRMD